MDSFAPTSTAYVGNLRSDRPSEELQREIQSLFESIGVSILLENIKAHRRSTKKPAYGFVSLKDKETLDICVEKLNGFASIDNKELIFPGKLLEVNIARRRQPLEVDKNVPQAKHRKGRKHSKKAKQKNTGVSNIKTVPVISDTTTYPVAISTNIPNNTNHPVSQENYFERPDPQERYYYVGQKLGTEDRLTEYKQGGGNYLDMRFKIHLEKYVCAFLNSEGGTLLVGVKDDCTVCGVEVSSHREDQLRLDIDKIMKGFHPHVFTNLYKVNFVPVYPCPLKLKSQAGQPVETKGSSTVDILGLNAVSDSVYDGRSDNSTETSLVFRSAKLLPLNVSTSTDTKTIAEFPNTKCNSFSLIEKSDKTQKDTAVPLEDLHFTCAKLATNENLVQNNLKVIEVEVHPPYCPTGEPSLYENNRGEVYVRRDGSIQGPLKASQIVEWSKQNMGQSYHLERNLLLQENQRKQHEIEELVKQQKNIENQHQEKTEKWKEKEGNLTAEINLLRTQESKMKGELDQIKRTRSKVCVLI